MRENAREKARNISRIVKLIIFAVLLAVIILTVKFTGLQDYLDKDRLQSWIGGLGPWGPIVYMLIYLIGPSLFLPGLPITIAGGVLFGPFRGVLYTIFAATGGASIAFLIARYLGREWVAERIKGTNLERLDVEVERQGWKIVAFTRLIPIFPFNLLNYAFGLTNIKFLHYAMASFICMLPATIAYIVFSSSLLDLLRGKVSVQLIVGIVLVIAVSFIPVYYKKRKSSLGKN